MRKHHASDPLYMSRKSDDIATNPLATTACPHAQCSFKGDRNTVRFHYVAHHTMLRDVVASDAALDLVAEARRDKSIAEGGERFKCEAPGCTFTCALRRQLNTHKQTHSSVRYPCSYDGCGYQAKRKEYLRLHVNGVHKKMKTRYVLCCTYTARAAFVSFQLLDCSIRGCNGDLNISRE